MWLFTMNADTMDLMHPVAEQEKFVREFIALYKENRLLWDKDHPKNKIRSERKDALEMLVLKCKEYYPEADVDFVKQKIDTLRGCFRKEYRKVVTSTATAKSPKDIHQPILWYYNLLLFTVGEEPNGFAEPSKDLSRLCFWNKEYTIMLIDLLEKHPVLYDPQLENNNSKRVLALRSITNQLISLTGKNFGIADVRKKIQMLKGQFRREAKNVKSGSDETIKPSLWCFDLLHFLKNSIGETVDNKKYKEWKNSMDSIERVEIKTEEVEPMDNDSDDTMDHFDQKLIFNNSNTSASKAEVNTEDIFDIIARNVSFKMRDMTNDQRIVAEKILNELMYHGMMENLTPNTRLSLDGT